MRDSTIRSRLRRRIILLAPAVFTASVLRAQNAGNVQGGGHGMDPDHPMDLSHSQNTGNGQTTIRPVADQPKPTPLQNADDKPKDVRLPNGKVQTDEILKDDYAKNLKDARDLTGLARGLEEDLEKNEAFVFSLTTLKKLDDMERLTKRIRSRMKRS
jgi:hypothetical protein